MNTIDSRLRLPVIDGHCHVFGLSLIKGAELHAHAKAGCVVFLKAGTQEALSFPAPVQLKAKGALIRPLSALTVVEVSEEGFDEVAALMPGSKTIELSEKPVDVCRYRGPSDFDVSKPKLTRRSGRFLDKSKGLHNFGYYANGNDGVNAWTVLDGVRDSGRGKAAVPLGMDMGYLPQEVGTAGEVVLSAIGRQFRSSSSGETRDYYVPDAVARTPDDVKWLWYQSRHFVYSLQALAEVCTRYPGQMWPFVPFDPRRARDTQMTARDGRSALQLVQWAIEELGFAGVKTYTRLGWIPWGNSAFYGDKVGGELDFELEAMYNLCCKQGLPVMSHMSPGGFPPPDEDDGCRPQGMLVYPKIYHSKPGCRGVVPETPPCPVKSNLKDWWHWAQLGLETAYNYCHYVQAAVSPYAWEKVLKSEEKPKPPRAGEKALPKMKWKNLRLCLAHAGTAAAIIARYYNDLVPKLGGKEGFRNSGEYGNLRIHACVAGEELFVKELLPDFAAWSGLAHLKHARGEIPIGAAEGVRSAVDSILRTDMWTKAMYDWKEAYPDDWLTKTIKMMDTYPNLYTDISCLAVGSEEPAFCAIFEALMDDVKDSGKAEILQDRLIFGTDWYMTESNGITAAKFWERLAKVVPDDSTLFLRCATLNTLRYLNLSPDTTDYPEAKCRMESMESRYKEAGVSPECLPDWWEDVKTWYRQQR